MVGWSAVHAAATDAPQAGSYKGTIDARTGEYPKLSVKRLFDEIRAAGYSRVRDYVRRPREGVEAAVRFETPAGRADQRKHRYLIRGGNLGSRSVGAFHIGCNALRDLRSRRLHRLSRKVGVAGRRLHLPVAEELSDHRQALPQR